MIKHNLPLRIILIVSSNIFYYKYKNGDRDVCLALLAVSKYRTKYILKSLAGQMEMAGIAACIIVMSSHCCDSLILYNFNVTHLLPLGSQITFSRVGFFPSKHSTTQHIWRVEKFLAVLLLLPKTWLERCLSPSGNSLH